MSSNQALMDRDLNVLWHPCTQMKDHEKLPLIPIKRGKGIWLEDYEGRFYIDAISSWWVNLFGHANPTINAAIQDQLATLEHVILAGFTHEPAIELAERLVEVTPPGLNKCFYADNGSSAIEVAIKMSFHYWKNLGKPNKTKFVTLKNSYHGETLGALSVSDVDLYKETYGPLLLEPIVVPAPDSFLRLDNETARDQAIRMFKQVEQVFAEQHDEICAIIVEPLVQCAGGMRMYDPYYLTLLKQACEQYDIHLIADEIAVGFGRTGTMFACEQADITPDIMCLSKGLTGGYLPLSVALTTDKMFDAFYDDYDTLKAFLHSHSYTGNALACRAALATLDLFKQENTIEKNTHLARQMSESIMRFEDHPHVGEVRQTGMIAAIELVQDKHTKTPFPWQSRLGLKIYEYALSHGALLRPLGNVIYFMPPYVITPKQIDKLSKIAYDGINFVLES